MSLVQYWNWMRKSNSLHLNGYGTPNVDGFMSFRGRTLKAEVTYGTFSFEVLCNSRRGPLEVSVQEMPHDKAEEARQIRIELETKLRDAVRESNLLLNAAF